MDKNQTTNYKREETFIGRREAMEKAARYATFTAAAMMTIIKPRESLATSGTEFPAEAPVDNTSPASRPVYPTTW